MATVEGVPQFLKNSIILQTFGVTYKHPCQEVENVVIPPYVSPESVRATVSKSLVTGQRDIFAFFRGKIEVHPKNVSGHFYSKYVLPYLSFSPTISCCNVADSKIIDLTLRSFLPGRCGH